jgi:hypothetical protein
MECRHVFSNGKRCRCAATPAHVFCRQHAPQPRVPTLRNRATPFRNWLDLRRALPTLDRAEIPPAILYLLSTLLEQDRISDRNAGALLRALLRRFGSVPFTLADDPAPEPDSAFALSQSIDRLMEIIRRGSAHHSALITNQTMHVPSIREVAGPTPIASQLKSIAIPH